VDAPRVAPGLRFLPSFLRRRLESRWLANLERMVGHDIRTVWLFENSRFFDLRFAGDRLKIYHQVDLNQEFHPGIASRTADVVFCTTDLIRERLLPHNSRVFKIHHGLAEVDNPLPLTEAQQGRFEAHGPHAVYIGNLEMAYLDVELLTNTVRRFPALHFHLVGGYSESGPLRRALASESNVTWWGKIDFRQIPSLLASADLLLVAYQVARADDQASPHKFMEYLASGKVVVATWTDEYKDKRHLLAMAEPGEDYLTLLQDVLTKLDTLNAPEQARLRRAFARQHTYGEQWLKIQSILTKHGFADPLSD
jgi:glycosyltransferase involved in cell wall biosynthesis